ncbi:hypothetical protein B9479_007667 [Cryptococcus floricola]|uniref:Uncharacterized protein n=1 Tax=Cryptococcus floricola TaxID=2591691 RepID=A0A5D3ANN7_9TREE|nr:hypothetical protein B9479_007667 [Cryptococcus floricola]
MSASSNISNTADAHRLFKGREVFAGLRDMVLLVCSYFWWVELSEHKKYRAIGLIFLPYVFMRWKWCATPYGTRVFGAAPATNAPPPLAHPAVSLAPLPTVPPSFAFWCFLLGCEAVSIVNLVLVLFLFRDLAAVVSDLV